MFGHDDICPKLHAELGSRTFECLAKPLARPITIKERKMTVAGKSQLAWLAGFVVAPPTLFDIRLTGLWISRVHSSVQPCLANQATAIARWHVMAKPMKSFLVSVESLKNPLKIAFLEATRETVDV